MRPSPAVLALLLAACPSPKDDSALDLGPYPRYCDTDWRSTLQPAIVGDVGEEMNGINSYISYAVPGSVLSTKFIPEHPFQLTTLRVSFAGHAGTTRLRLVPTFGRSYPDVNNETGPDLMEPIDVTLDADPVSGEWTLFDVSDQDIFLHPTLHYAVAMERGEDDLYLGLAALGDDPYSRSYVTGFSSVDNGPAPVDGDFMIELEGNYFCAWGEDDFWFAEQTDAPFAEVASGRAAFTDLNSDGHDDLVVNDGNPRAFLGDGDGGFTELAGNWPDAAGSPMLVFGDVDNDGDRDAFAAYYVGANNDGDTHTLEEGDCDDADAATYPGAEEIAGNGKDDDCDGSADDGTDASDADGDGTSIAEGDCDDTNDTVAPGAPEVLDSRDNDCDRAVDEDWHHKILLNDGTGHFTLVAEAGVERTEPATAAGWADGNQDGFLDLTWGNWLEKYPNDAAVQDRYVEGNGDGTFVDVTERAGMMLASPKSCYGLEWNDWDNDGLQDIFVGNYHLYANHLWHNRGDGTFEDVAVAVGVAYDDIPSGYSQYPGGHTYGGDFGDIDNDGDMDFFMANLAHPRTQPWGDPSMFVVNQGAPDYLMVNQREELGIVYDEGDINGQFADYDNDGDLDLAIASLYPTHYTKLYRNDGPDGFTDVTYETHTAQHVGISVTWSDVDEDGDLDLVEADGADLPMVHLYLNRVGQDRPWVQFDLQGTPTNRDAVGARVTLTAGGMTQMRDISGGGGQSNTQVTRIAHFGLGDATSVDQVTVRWVGGGNEVITGVEPNHRYRVVEGSGVAVEVY